MKTRDELENLTKEELLAMVLDLQESKEMWLSEAQKIRQKLNAVKNIVGSMVVFID